MSDPSEYYTDAGREEAFEDIAERISDEEERLREGKVELPWPDGSNPTLFLAALSLFSAGGAFGGAILTDGDAMFLISIVLLVSGIALLKYGMWVRGHFETGEQPTYDTWEDDA